MQPSPGHNLKNRAALGSFFAIIGGLALLSLLLGFAAIPRAYVHQLNLGLAMLYLGLPILAIYRAASADWSKSMAAYFLLGGIVGWGVFIALDQSVLHHQSIGSGIAVALSQVGIQTACVGLGALLATLIKDKNILIPIAIFLAIYDIFLVRTDMGPTHQLMTHAPAILQTTGVRIPAVSSHHGSGLVEAGAYVGDADMVSLAAFFVALFRFRMRTRQTLIAMVPTLLVYLLVVVQFGVQLPALLPIGAVILLVNRPEFKLTRDEQLGTGLVAACALGLLVWGLTRPKIDPETQSGTLPPEISQRMRGLPRSPVKANPGQPQSISPSAPAGK